MVGAGERRVSFAVVSDRYDRLPGWEAASQNINADVTSGPVLPSPTLGYVGWAIYIGEYWHMRQRPLGLEQMPVGNVVYREKQLLSWDLHTRLARAGATAEWREGLSVELARPPSLPSYFRERYRFSRLIARGPRSLLFVTSRLLLPPLVLYRMAGCGYPLRFATTLPLLLLFSIVQMAGEIHGGLKAASDTLES
jgi:hypothetical protein